MPQALGLVETKGLVGAIVAADAMLKAANVSLIGKEKVTPALITIKIIGETAAVKSAIEAGASAAQRVGQLISTHLIPHPDSQLGILFPEILAEPNDIAMSTDISNLSVEKEISHKPIKPKKDPSTRKAKVESRPIEPEISSHEEKVQPPLRHASLFDEVIESPADHTASTLERLKAEALHDLQSEETRVTEVKKADTLSEVEEKFEYNDSSASLVDLESFNVHQLRKLARGVEIFPIHGREISRANRDTLLAYFKSLKK
ncbi:MAG: BMC domain-containing protein [Ignavibacteriaceae bacterium]|jgi:ethanolamine utilization protein EutM